ncbi:IPT/TIG domain-containing protein [Silvibacterium acidisoli]|uniref:IPT/TIG domain-containing protein n=1 Tax=Acidobacteriaceae bacterium ZG23-2 TaxID=2883246 RepID=UPI00406CAB31
MRQDCLDWKRVLFVALVALLCLIAGRDAYAGGTRWTAGSSYFSASAKGVPIVWAGGSVRFFLDQGALSTTETSAQASAMVIAAANVWNAVTTAEVQIAYAGTLSEDVSGLNVTNANGVLSEPADILPADTARPVAVIYDADGSVIDALYGQGASNAARCDQNGVMVTVDNFSTAGNIVHATMIVNGLCSTTAAGLAVLPYQLVRGFGQVLGLDWSQVNEAMFLDNQISTAGLAGWPVMHPIERLCNATGLTCLPNGTTLRLDDIAALNRAYPVTSANLGAIAGKVLTAANTVSVKGTVQFKRGQGMQGVNVVLTPFIPGTDLPDLRYTVSAVSGAAFQGQAGNPVTGMTDAQGNALNRFGTDDETMEGFFDLSGIPLPAGETTASYQLSLEAIDPLYVGASSVGPYTSSQVTPSGTMPTLSLSGLTAGSNLTQNIVIENSADASDSADDGIETQPANLSPSGQWTSRLSGYGHTSWLQWHVHANRVFTVEAMTFDDSSRPTIEKAEPVLGIWNATDATQDPPATATAEPFNGLETGLTTLPVTTLSEGEVRLAVSDFRGDGRPDYLYGGRVLYADAVAPARLGSGGGPIVIAGLGFRVGNTVTVGGVAATVTGIDPTEITAIAPPSNGVTGDVVVEVRDPQSWGVAMIPDGLSYDAQTGDALAIVTAPQNTVAMDVPLPFTVQARGSDGMTPAAGVTVSYTVTQGQAALGCGQATCEITTAGDGTATVMVQATTAVLAQVTASLTNGARILAEFTGGVPPSISAVTPNLYVAIGGAATWQPQGLVLSHGAPAANEMVSWTSASSRITTLSNTSTSGASGIVTQQVQVSSLAAGDVIPVNACLAESGSCAQFNVTAVHTETALLVPESGTNQEAVLPQGLAPVTIKVTDAVGHPMAGAPVTFYETLEGWTPACAQYGPCPTPPVLQQQTLQGMSVADGTVSFTPLSIPGQPSRLFVTAVTGSSSSLTFELQQYPEQGP